MKQALALLVGVALAACTGQWQPPDFMQTKKQAVVAACPSDVVGQARWVQNNVTRLRLGGSRRDAMTVLGPPGHVESFLLADNSAIDVLYYHTPETACRPAAALPVPNSGLLPLVFQNDRLLGYGQGYYQQMVVPNLRQPLGLPVDRVISPQEYPKPAVGAVGRGMPLR